MFDFNQKPDLNITPLVDIMLVLLAILMVTAPVIEFEEPINLPTGSKSQQSQDKKPERDYGLTSRETQILKLITEGYSNNEIANQLFVSINTTKAHVASILQKLEVDDRLQAALKALKYKIV